MAWLRSWFASPIRLIVLDDSVALNSEQKVGDTRQMTMASKLGLVRRLLHDSSILDTACTNSRERITRTTGPSAADRGIHKRPLLDWLAFTRAIWE